MEISILLKSALAIAVLTLPFLYFAAKFKLKGYEWEYGRCKVPVKSPDGKDKAEYEVPVRYNKRNGRAQIKTQMPRKVGKSEWRTVYHEDLKQKIKKHALEE